MKIIKTIESITELLIGNKAGHSKKRIGSLKSNEKQKPENKKPIN